jgi:cytoskeletal protein CcmA (bactofilin family)
MGGNQVQIENGKIEGDVAVKGDFQLNGMITGGVSVKRGGRFYLNGMVVGGLTVEEGGHAEVRGMVNGDATNVGGTLEVYGMVRGAVRGPSASTFVDSNAVVGSKAIA